MLHCVHQRLGTSQLGLAVFSSRPHQRPGVFGRLQQESCPELEAAHTGSSCLVWYCPGLHFAAGHPLGCDGLVNLGQAPPALVVTSMQAPLSQAHLFCWHIVDEFVGHLAANLEPQPLPLLKSKAGRTRRIPRVNRLLLLKRMASQKRHRAETMRTHGNLTSKSAALVTFEKSIEVSQYMLQMVQSFSHHRDPGCSDL